MACGTTLDAIHEQSLTREAARILIPTALFSRNKAWPRRPPLGSRVAPIIRNSDRFESAPLAR